MNLLDLTNGITDLLTAAECGSDRYGDKIAFVDVRGFADQEYLIALRLLEQAKAHLCLAIRHLREAP